jgi:hypothetical protein
MHRLQCSTAAIALAVIAFATSVRAQSAQTVTPRGGTWGIETVPFTAGGSLLRFSSPSAAWLVGATVNYTHTDQPSAIAAGTVGLNATSVRAQLGHRWYEGQDAHLRMTYGLGAIGALGLTNGETSQDHNWSAGGYGEFGATWFFTPHLSLGGVGMLQALWGHDRQTGTGLFNNQPVTTTSSSNTFTIGATVMRATAAVYF